MKVVQVLPELNSGGVERGTVDFARELVRRGHQSTVISNGGRMVAQLIAQGSQHIAYPVHRKSLFSLRHVRPLRRLLMELKPDIVHVRSRLPAWLVWLALRKIPKSQRPALVSTFHGLYSVNRYSEIMGCGDAVIAISDCVRDYIFDHYPRIDRQKVSVVYRGVDTEQFNGETMAPESWQEQFYQEFPGCKGKAILTMPGRLSRWKGQPEFIKLIAALVSQGVACHGLIVGDISPGKESYQQELRRQVEDAGLQNEISFTGHRSDIEHIYALSAVVYNLSQHPEPFGRTVIEALAMGVPVIAYRCGGPAESLRDCLPQGLIDTGDIDQLIKVSRMFIEQRPTFNLPVDFTLPVQADRTIAIYQQLVSKSG